MKNKLFRGSDTGGRRYRVFINDDRKPRMTNISLSENNLHNLLGDDRADVKVSPRVMALRGVKDGAVAITILVGLDANGNGADLPLTTDNIKAMCPSWFESEVKRERI